ncbi:chromosome condensation complex Condensin, subunit G, partial [Coemansia nantahalensis]
LRSDSGRVQATAGEGIARLLYARRIPDPAPVLEELLVLYFDPATADNDALRQCLAYFFPAFSYMAPDNQALMQQVAVGAIARLARVLKPAAAAGDAPAGATQGQAAQQIVTWADPRILAALAAMSAGGSGRGSSSHAPVRIGSYAQLGVDALKRTFTEPPATRKVLVQMLNKLGLDDATPHTQLQQMFVLTRALAQQALLSDMITRNALARFEATLLKHLEIDSADSVSLEAWLEEPEMRWVFEFVASLDEDAGPDAAGDSDDDDDDATTNSGGASGAESDASDRRGGGASLAAVRLGPGLPPAAGRETRSPLKRAREQRLEELTREIDELLDSDEDEDDPSGYMSAEE